MTDHNASDQFYPEVTVQLTGTDGNAFSIMGRTMRSLRKAGVSEERVQEYWREATSGDYNDLLNTTMKWVSVT